MRAALSVLMRREWRPQFIAKDFKGFIRISAEPE
jgi:hypothetical protein